MEFGLLQPQNTSERVWNSFAQGRQMGQEMATQKAMSALAGNPDDPKVMQRLLDVNPEMGMRFQQQRQQQQQQGLERYRGDIIKGAQIFRQFGVKDEATYQAARNASQQLGIDVSQVPPNFDPAYVNGVVQIADTFEPAKQNEGPSSVQEFQFAKQQGFQGSYMDFMEEKRGPIVANNGDGTFTLIPRGQMQQGGGAVPPPPPGFVIDGGPTPQASGGFPDPLAPR